jgi:glycine/D-amino acid oxidase-like deaminating enzyme
VVVGAGPAGGLAALDLAQRGLRVLLVEKQALPRWKVCGCCLNAQAQAVLATVGQGQLIDRQGGVPLQRLWLGLRGRRASLALPDGRALSRERFDQALVEAAIAAGASFRASTTAHLGAADASGRAVTLQQRGSRRPQSVRAKVVLVAAGLAQRCIPASEAGAGFIQRHSRIGAGCVLPGEAAAYPAGSIHMAIGSQGYVGLVRREDGQLNLAAAFDRQALHANAAGAARAVLASAGFPIPAGLESAFWCWATRRATWSPSPARAWPGPSRPAPLRSPWSWRGWTAGARTWNGAGSGSCDCGSAAANGSAGAWRYSCVSQGPPPLPLASANTCRCWPNS